MGVGGQAPGTDLACGNFLEIHSQQPNTPPAPPISPALGALHVVLPGIWGGK